MSRIRDLVDHVANRTYDEQYSLLLSPGEIGRRAATAQEAKEAAAIANMRALKAGLLALAEAVEEELGRRFQ